MFRPERTTVKIPDKLIGGDASLRWADSVVLDDVKVPGAGLVESTRFFQFFSIHFRPAQIANNVFNSDAE